MEYREFLQKAGAGEVRGVYLLEGTEEYIKSAALEKLRKAVLPEGMEQLNETLLENPAPDALIAACETLPFMADKRLVIVRELAALSGRAEADERLLAYLPKMSDTCVLVLYAQGKADARKKLYLAVKKCGNVVTFNPMDEATLNKWICQTARSFGKTMGSQTAANLSFTVGSDAALLRTEIAKLAGYVGEREEITAQDIAAVATRSMECTVFQMVDAVVAGQEGRAFGLLHDMLATGSDRLGILAMLLRQYRLMLHVKIMQHEKVAPAEMRKLLGMPSFAADRTIRQASGFTGRQVRNAADLCLDAEYKVKSGTWNQDGALEATMLGLFRVKKG